MQFPAVFIFMGPIIIKIYYYILEIIIQGSGILLLKLIYTYFSEVRLHLGR